MIVKNDSVIEQSKWQELQTRINNLVKDNKIKNNSGNTFEINSIEDYYSNISGIVKLEKLDPSVLRVPLDEPIININADTRKIELNNNFGKTQLLTVEKDHLAETIYFQIDRYFDLQDLASTDIFIQYYLNDQVQGYSKAVLVDTSTAGKVIFGWQISNEITEESGTLQFSIIFFRKDSGSNELIYVFNTLPAQMVINKTLTIDEELSSADPVDYLSDYLSSLVDSKKSNGFGSADTVAFLDGILNNKSVYITGDKLYALAYNDSQNNLDNTVINYKWICSYNGVNTQLQSGISSEYKKIVEDNSIFSASMRYNSKITYYTKANNSYMNSSGDINEDNYEAQKENLYLKVYYCTVDTCGSYSVVAYGSTANDSSKEVAWTGLSVVVKGIDENFDVLLSPSPDNGYYYFDKGASKEITTSLKNGDGVECEYQWTNGGNSFGTNDSVSLTEEGTYTLTVKASKNKDSRTIGPKSFTAYFDPVSASFPIPTGSVKTEDGKYVVEITNSSELGNGSYRYEWKNADGQTIKTTNIENSIEVDETITQVSVRIIKGNKESNPITFSIS